MNEEEGHVPGAFGTPLDFLGFTNFPDKPLLLEARFTGVFVPGWLSRGTMEAVREAGANSPRPELTPGIGSTQLSHATRALTGSADCLQMLRGCAEFSHLCKVSLSRGRRCGHWKEGCKLACKHMVTRGRTRGVSGQCTGGQGSSQILKAECLGRPAGQQGP